MRIHRIRLANFRGVAACDVEFADNGITIVEGPNEVGKTSLAEALSVILENPDSSRSRIVTSIKPVHADVGPEIEVELSLGQYRFQYSKRFLKGPRTEVRISKPAPRQLNGREAHDWVSAVFKEHVDEPLWKAMWMQQGVNLDQADLSAQTSLGAALDHTSGELLGGELDEAVFSKVEAVYGEFFQARARPSRLVQAATDAEVNAKKKLDEADAGLRLLEETVEAAMRLEVVITEKQLGVAELKSAFTDTESRWQAVEKELRDVETLRSAREVDKTKAEASAAAHKARHDQLSDLEKQKRDQTNLQGQLDALAPALKAARGGLETAGEDLRKAEASAQKARALHTLKQIDFGHHRDRLDLELMKERWERIQKAQKEAAKAGTLLASPNINRKTMDQIEAAEVERQRVQARLDIESPKYRIVGGSTGEIKIDGKLTRLARDGEITGEIPDKVIFEIPGRATIEVVGGLKSGEASRDLQTSEQKLRELLKTAHASTLDAARKLLEEQVEAERDLKAATAIVKQDLRDFTSTVVMEQRMSGLSTQIETYAKTRRATLPLPADFETAKKEDAAAQREMDRAEEVAVAARTVRDAAQTAFDAESQKHGELEQKRAAVRTVVEALSGRLETDRTVTSDVDLAESRRKADTTASLSEVTLSQALKNLARIKPESVKLELETVDSAYKRGERDLREAMTKQQEIAVTLKVKGEQGLRSVATQARSESMVASQHRRGIDDQAAAAKVLFDTLTKHRASARTAYREPLHAKIEGLAKIVFGDDLSIELADDLRIQRRTLHGQTVEFGQLSTGAREQLAVIARLACAALVSREGGVPLILDDALGWSDPVRLMKMGAALTAGSKECQVIVMTCSPNRYKGVAAAKVVKLA